MALLEQPVGVERERRERRVRAEEAGHDGGAHPRVLEARLERLDHEADQERPGDVDDEDAPRERARAPADQLVEAVAGERTERAGDRDPDHDRHRGGGYGTPPQKQQALWPSPGRSPSSGRTKPRTTRRRVKKRAPKTRSHHHPELWGLGMVAVGLFLATVLWLGWDGGTIGADVADGLHGAFGVAAYVDPARPHLASAS